MQKFSSEAAEVIDVIVQIFVEEVFVEEVVSCSKKDSTCMNRRNASSSNKGNNYRRKRSFYKLLQRIDSRRRGFGIKAHLQELHKNFRKILEEIFSKDSRRYFI